MKLVDILAQELKVWPEGADWVVSVLEDLRAIASFGFKGLPEPDKFDRHGHTWTVVRTDGRWEIHSRFALTEEPEDRITAIVTRAEWQAAVDALNAPKVVEWDGVGLPPVGAVCDVLNSDLGNPAWERCTILYSGKHRVMYDSESCEERVAFIESLTLRKARTIRTPEQVAAEEREAEISKMLDIINAAAAGGSGKAAARALYDAGYHKQ